MQYTFENCQLCPRNCGVDRRKTTGFCRVGSEITLARAALHHWEEPCISGTNGSGTVFFVGCNVGCVFCQNGKISRGKIGKTVSDEVFLQILFDLKEQGAHNINLVTPMHFAPAIARVIEPNKRELGLPIVCNTGGYDLPQTLLMMEQTVDVYLPDFKFADSETAMQFCHASDYPTVALAAIKEMVRQTGKPQMEGDLLQRGTLVRHLILPGCRKDSLRVLDILASEVGAENILLSLMSQYTPQPDATGNLKRRVTSFEYQSVLEHALKLGFTGFMQDRSSAQSVYTPDFDLTGL